jgi:hypothetical protein
MTFVDLGNDIAGSLSIYMVFGTHIAPLGGVYVS